MSELGNLLKKLRGRESLRDVAKRAGISHTYLSIIEKGIDLRSGGPVKPTPETLKSLSKAYRYDYEELMKIAGYIDGEQSAISAEDEFIEGIDLELTDDQLLDKFNLTVDGMKLGLSEAKEFIAFVRAKRSLK